MDLGKTTDRSVRLFARFSSNVLEGGVSEVRLYTNWSGVIQWMVKKKEEKSSKAKMYLPIYGFVYACSRVRVYMLLWFINLRNNVYFGPQPDCVDKNDNGSRKHSTFPRMYTFLVCQMSLHDYITRKLEILAINPWRFRLLNENRMFGVYGMKSNSNLISIWICLCSQWDKNPLKCRQSASISWILSTYWIWCGLTIIDSNMLLSCIGSFKVAMVF